MKPEGSFAFSPSESARFGLAVFRAEGLDINAGLLTEHILANQPDLVIFRQKVGTAQPIPFLFPQIHADTLTYYTCDLQSLPAHQGRQDFSLEVVLPHQKAKLLTLATDIFQGYPGHYQASPYMAASAIGAGYGEWAGTFCHADQRIAWLALKEGQVAGFAACSFDPAAKTCEGVLYGVHPHFQGQGVYTFLIRATASYFQQKGYLTMDVATQVRHTAVQQVWAKTGFRLSHAADTYHLYPLLAIAPSHTFTLTENNATELMAGLLAYGNDASGTTAQWTWLQPFAPRVAYTIQIASPTVKNNLGFSLKVARVYYQDHFLCALVYWYERRDDPIQ